MFEAIKAKALVWAANRTNLMLIPSDRATREIAEAMLIDGAPVSEINQTTHDLWRKKVEEKPIFVSTNTPVAKVDNGPLRFLEGKRRF